MKPNLSPSKVAPLNPSPSAWEVRCRRAGLSSGGPSRKAFVIRGPGWLGPRSAYSSARLRWMNGTERREQCRAAIRALQQAVETVGHTRYLRNSQADFHQHVSATLLAAAQEGFACLVHVTNVPLWRSAFKNWWRGWPKARNVIDTQEQAAISKSGEALLLLPLHFQICL